MLEILILFSLSKKISRIVRANGRGSGAYVTALICFWFVGEIAGGVIAATVAVALAGGGEPPMLETYVGCLIGAVTGAWFAFRLAHRVPRPLHDELAADDDFYEQETGHERAETNQAAGENEPL
jgi:membrane protein DedA with SNARE-associated domain